MSGKNRVLKSETLNLFQANRVNSLSFRFVHSSSNSVSAVSMLLNCLSIPSRPFAYLLTSGYLLQTPHNFNFFAISLEGSSYRESTVFFFFFSLFHLLVFSFLCVCVFCVAAFCVRTALH